MDRSLYAKNGIRLLFAGDNKELTNPIFSEDTKHFLIQEGEAHGVNLTSELPVCQKDGSAHKT